MKRDSIANTIIVALGVCLVCSFFVSFAAVGLRARQERNALLDRKRNILIAAGWEQGGEAGTEKVTAEDLSGDEVEKLFAELVIDRIIEFGTGQDVTEQLVAENDWSGPIEYDQASEAADEANKLDPKQDIAGVKRREPYSHVYLIRKAAGDPAPSTYVFPIRGYGLWSMLKGFVALDADLKTIKGVTYYEHLETPGLGGEVDNPNWKEQWKGKVLYGPEGNVQIRLLKNADPANPHAVDALSGATITSRGVENMFKYWMGEQGFGPYIQRLRDEVPESAQTANESMGRHTLTGFWRSPATAVAVVAVGCVQCTTIPGVWCVPRTLQN